MLTDKEKLTNLDTMIHIQKVNFYLNKVIKELLSRGEQHDHSKLSSPEVEAFTEVNAELAGLTYGSPEYDIAKKKLGTALNHHYANSRHHPEHFENGVMGMNLIDLIEMYCDWKASSTRHNDGNIRKSIDINSSRFQLGPVLTSIFKNTADWIDN